MRSRRHGGDTLGRVDDRTETVSLFRSPGANAPVCLRIIEGCPAREPLILDEATTVVIGREEGLGLRLEAEGVSRRHARITHGDGQYRIIDLGSKNGTFVNWEPVDVAPLRVGDRIDIGKVGLQFDWLDNDSVRPSSSKKVLSARSLLSVRELEIAELVGQGLTNAEIGRKLGISRRTVATHLENAYQRLGIHSRAALVRKISGDD